MAGKQRDVFFADRSLAGKAADFFDFTDRYTLPAKGGFDVGVTDRAHLAFKDFAFLILTLPSIQRVFFLYASEGHDGYVHYSLVQLSISAIEVKPCFTFSKPARRKSFTPSNLAWSAMSYTVPLFIMRRLMASLMGIT